MLQRQHLLSVCTWYTFLLIVVTCNEYKGFDDTVLFKINWPGADEKLLVNIHCDNVSHWMKHQFMISIRFTGGVCNRKSRINCSDNTSQREIQMPAAEYWGAGSGEGDEVRWFSAIGSGFDTLFVVNLFVPHRKLLDVRGVPWQLCKAISWGARGQID